MTAKNLSLFPARVDAVTLDRKFSPEVLRALYNLYNLVVGNGGASSGVDPAIGGVNIANFSMLSGAVPASRRWEYPNTNPNGWNTKDGVNPRAGQMTLNADFVSTNYFALNPGGHLVVGLRCDTAVIATQARFAGIILGNVSGAAEGAPNFPTTQIETKAEGLAPGGNFRFMFPNSQGPASKPLTDGVTYRLCIRSSLTENNQRMIRYQLWRFNSVRTAWDIEVDSGDMLDHNTWLDYTKSGLVFASVFEGSTAAGAWSVAWSNISVTWAGVKDSASDLSERLNRYDALLAGNLTFEGMARRLYLYTDSAGTAFNNWTQLVSSTLNSNTSVVAVPNGTSVASNFLATNNSSLATNFSYATYGMNGALAELTTGGVGTGAVPNFAVKIGSTTTATFKTTGIRLLTGTEDMGLTSTRLTGVSNTGGPAALALVQSPAAQNLETYCTAGNIAAQLGPTYSATNIETVFRPIFAIASAMLADLQARKVL